MQKRKLDIDHLEVESFATEPVSGARGTVQAHITGPTNCNPDTCDLTARRTCDTCNTCNYSCWDTCDIEATCAMSCNPTCVVTLGACCPPES